LVEYKIKSLNPKSHIKLCSLVNYFMIEIINERFGTKDDNFYGEFHVKSTEESYEILSEDSEIILEFIPGKVIR
jgi:hypothetical protein